MPLASASVSQVHKARLPDGRIVAVKVRRPDVVELCTFDLAVMRIGARVLNAIPSIATLSPVATVEEFGRAIFAQLDFRIEARNNRRFRENFRGDPDVVFPEVIDELSTRAHAGDELRRGHQDPATARRRSDPKRVARLGLQALLKMIFEDGFVHADLHPGNILITPRGQGRDPRSRPGRRARRAAPRAAFARFFAAWAQRDGKTMAQATMSASLSPGAHGTPDYDGLRALRGDRRVRRPLLGAAPGRGAGLARSRSTCWPSCAATACA